VLGAFVANPFYLGSCVYILGGMGGYSYLEVGVQSIYRRVLTGVGTGTYSTEYIPSRPRDVQE